MNYSYLYEGTIVRSLLPVVMLAASKRIPQSILDRCKVESFLAQEAYELVLRVCVPVVGKSYELPETVLVPLTWRDSFTMEVVYPFLAKRGWWRSWLRITFPSLMRYKTREIKTMVRNFHLCPHLETKDMRDNKVHVVWVEAQ